jgi:oxygen-dependent protoporphyrinogen oxidase
VTRRVDVAVVGGGITGLAAAWEATRRGADIVVLEAAPTLGGKLRTSPFAGVPLDEAADAFLVRVPEALELCDELGLGADLVAPSTGAAYVWSEGALRRLPADQLLGVPVDLDAVARSGVLSADGLARARLDLTGPDDRPGGDESVGSLVRRRLGDEVLDRLVAPLLGGIWAGDCDRLSLEVAAPMLAAARALDQSLVRGAAAVRAEAASDAAEGRPVFLAPRGGMARLVDALAQALGERVWAGAPVASLEPDHGRWRLGLTPPAGAPAAAVSADRVVLAAPAFASAQLLAGVAPDAARLLSAIDYASVVLTALAVPRDGVDHPLDGSGFLVPQSAGLTLTACSWVTSKWGHLGLDAGTVVMRASTGRDGDDRSVALDDDQLLAALVSDLRTTMGLRAEPTEVRVNRWIRSFPQPRPGHLAVVAAVEAALAACSPRLAATGAWARGVGIPACIRGGRAPATQVLDELGTG